MNRPLSPNLCSLRQGLVGNHANNPHRSGAHCAPQDSKTENSSVSCDMGCCDTIYHGIFMFIPASLRVSLALVRFFYTPVHGKRSVQNRGVPNFMVSFSVPDETAAIIGKDFFHFACVICHQEATALSLTDRSISKDKFISPVYPVSLRISGTATFTLSIRASIEPDSSVRPKLSFNDFEYQNISSSFQISFIMQVIAIPSPTCLLFIVTLSQNACICNGFFRCLGMICHNLLC